MSPRRRIVIAADVLEGVRPVIGVPLEPLSSPSRPPEPSEAASGRGAAVRAGQAAARARGVRIGRPRSYDDDQAAAVRELAAGRSLRQLAVAAGLSLATVQRILAEAP